MPGATVRLTMAQALVRYLCNQFTEIDGAGTLLFAGCSRSSATATSPASARRSRRSRTRCPPGAARTSSRWRWPPSASPRPSAAGRSWSPPSIGPGATNMVTAAGLAHSNRLPVLLLAGDTFANRRPDPVMQQVKHFGNPTVTVNDASSRSAATGTGRRRPSRSSARCPRRSRRCSTRPTAARPSFALPGHPGDRLRLSGRVLRADRLARSRARAPTATGWPRRWRCSRPQEAADHLRRRRPLFACRGDAGAVRPRPRHSDLRDHRRQGALTHDHAAHVGPIGILGSTSANALAAEADVVLAIGTRLMDFTTGS